MASVNEQLLPAPARSDSLKSVSSTSSAVSLTRRSRVRTRTTTLPGKRGRSLGPPEESERNVKLVTDEATAAYPLQSPASPQPGPSRHNTPDSRAAKSPQRARANTATGVPPLKPSVKRAVTLESSGDIDSMERGRNHVAGPSKVIASTILIFSNAHTSK
jgi:hypothetical protein